MASSVREGETWEEREAEGIQEKKKSSGELLLLCFFFLDASNLGSAA